MKIFTAIGLLFSFFFGALRYGFVPTVVFDAAAPGAPVSSRASGYLYGLAEEDVPDSLMVQSLDLSSVSQKVLGGLQHPIGDVDHVAENLDSCDYIVVYLQDVFPSWYYAHEEIGEARRAGTWNWRAFLEREYFPRVRKAVEALRVKPYADRLVYCLYNECDNGVWFGTTDANGSGIFDEEGAAAFFEAWKTTFRFVRALDPAARIGGPGYCDYDASKEAWFLNYCAENDCLPDVMIWHELGERSSEQLDLHVKNYRILEELSDVSPLPIIITEYGMMEECGDPAKMFRYIRQIEETGVYGNIAYWRLADNLNDACADGVSPNACWWLYRWYADMEGNLLAKEVRDLFHADVGKALKECRETRNKHLNGFGALNEEKNGITVLLGGADYKAQVRFKHLNKTNLRGRVRVKVEQVSFEGLGGKVFAPATVTEYVTRTCFGGLTVKLPQMDENAVYHITVAPAAEKAPKYVNDNIPVRYEFERGTLLGAAYTYDSAYATTGETAGMVGGIERPGDGVRLLFTVPQRGNYELTVVYGKANDGTAPESRVSAAANMALDGVPREISLPNTIRSEYTSSFTVTEWLEPGDHSLEFTHGTGTYVLDSMLVRRAETGAQIAVLPEKEASDENQTGYIAVAPQNGRYLLDTNAEAVWVNGSACAHAAVYLRQGLNLITLAGAGRTLAVSRLPEEPHDFTVGAASLELSGGAKLENGAVTGVTSGRGSAAFTVSVPAAGDYCVTLTYSCNAEGGFHAYNVDLVEQYFTVTLGEITQRVWCRSTYSDENRAAVCFNARLRAGTNEFVLTNDGAVTFNGGENACPRLYEVTLDAVSRPAAQTGIKP